MGDSSGLVATESVRTRYISIVEYVHAHTGRIVSSEWLPA
jgi:hypothetical protein